MFHNRTRRQDAAALTFNWALADGPAHCSLGRGEHLAATVDSHRCPTCPGRRFASLPEARTNHEDIALGINKDLPFPKLVMRFTVC